MLQALPTPISKALPITEPTFEYDSVSDNLSEAFPQETQTKEYVDRLEPEIENSKKKDFHILTEGKNFEDSFKIDLTNKLISETDSLDSIEQQIKPFVESKKEAIAVAHCDLQRTEDRSKYDVIVALALTEKLVFLLQQRINFLKDPIKKDIHILKAGHNFVDSKKIGMHRNEDISDTESIDSMDVYNKPNYVANSIANCDLKRSEDRSTNDVAIALPLLYTLTFVLRIEHRHKPQKQIKPVAYDISHQGKEFYNKIILKENKEYDFEKEEIPEIIPQIKINEKYLSEDSFSSNSTQQEQPSLAIYDIQTSGQNLEGSSRICNLKRYSSETSLDEEKHKIKGVTHVFLIKKEAYATFEVIIECSNTTLAECLRAREVPTQKYENLEYIKNIERLNIIPNKIEVEVILSCANIFKSLFDSKEINQEHITLMYNIENNNFKLSELSTNINYRDTNRELINLNCFENKHELISTIVYLKNNIEKETPAINLSLHEKRFSVGHNLQTKSQSIEHTNQQVHVERKECDQTFHNVEGNFKSSRNELIKKNLQEFKVINEHCSILMENRGAIMEQIGTDWGFSSTGEHKKINYKFVKTAILNYIPEFSVPPQRFFKKNYFSISSFKSKITEILKKHTNIPHIKKKFVLS